MPPPHGSRRKKKPGNELQRLSFQYDSNILELTSRRNGTASTTGVMLIHPIGVGIGKWFYNRLFESLHVEYNNSGGGTTNLIVVAPDLLGSGTACNPINWRYNQTEIDQLPLLNVKDWSSQISRLMANLEREYPQMDRWCLVANGGCSPIALQVAKQSIQNQPAVSNNNDSSSNFQPHGFVLPVTNVVLSSVPRLPFFLPPDDNQRLAKREKLQKSYKTLCGIPGRLFWWYSLRNQGAFIQKFSERNLVADAANLGPSWTPNCVATAQMHQGKSRYSTFAFLAGSLQVDNGCRTSLYALWESSDQVKVDIVQGRDRRRNKAKSWFWQKKKKQSANTNNEPPRETLQQVLERNGNRGKVFQCGGRISLAHEDAPGYAKALLEILSLAD